MASVRTLTLVANQVSTVNLSGNFALVKVLNMNGAGELWFTTDGVTDPVIGSNNIFTLPAAICSDDFPDETPGSFTVVKLLSSAATRVSVRGV